MTAAPTVATPQATESPTAEATQSPTPQATVEATQEATETPLTPTAELTGEPEATATTDASAGESTYTSKRSGVSFEFPADWEVDLMAETSGSGTLVDQIGLRPPDGDALVLLQVYQLNRSLEESDLPLLKQDVDAKLQQVFKRSGGKLIESQEFERGGFRGYEYVFTYKRGQDESMVHLYTTAKGNRQYSVQLEGAQEKHERYTTVLEQVLDSLQLPNPEETQDDATNANASNTPGQYKSRNHGFAFRYPTAWKVTKAQEGIGQEMEDILIQPEGVADAGMGITLRRLNMSIDNPVDPKIKKELDQALAGAAESIGGKVISSKQSNIGKLRGFEYLLSYEVDGKPYRSKQFHFIVEDKQYAIRLETPQSNLNEYQKALTQVLRLFQTPR